jgi:hypothetical protein
MTPAMAGARNGQLYPREGSWVTFCKPGNRRSSTPGTTPSQPTAGTITIELDGGALSPSNWRYDLVTKAAIYARLGVREYWVLDPENETILVQVLRDRVFVPLTSDDGIACSEILPGFAVDPKVLFAWPPWMKS